MVYFADAVHRELHLLSSLSVLRRNHPNPRRIPQPEQRPFLGSDSEEPPRETMPKGTEYLPPFQQNLSECMRPPAQPTLLHELIYTCFPDHRHAPDYPSPITFTATSLRLTLGTSHSAVFWCCSFSIIYQASHTSPFLRLLNLQLAHILWKHILLTFGDCIPTTFGMNVQLWTVYVQGSLTLHHRIGQLVILTVFTYLHLPVIYPFHFKIMFFDPRMSLSSC